ncbi:protein of unknown function [Pseudobutyrivibrio sp. YE44]|uniref:DUF5050 domain-containing protein n=1 Tax=Pseudobutyrivibrio sp. YE44 TaxID=1520802 RepID=UPI00088C6BD7|nr:DUF5050 domain-containing protein [Pseudobutyrivibrio sp. YE44]SDB10760.1 protein of unknown function [Pseudobutyrivibrio sp. YE44]
MKIVRRVLIVVAFVAFVGGAGYYKYINTVTHFNETNVNGNTIGNLYGNGLFCEIDGVVYFANPNDYHRIYSMNPDETNVQIVANDSVYFINADPYYLYYCRQANRDNSQFGFLNVNLNSLCRMTRKNKKVMILDDADSTTCALAGNTILYQRHDETAGISLYSVKIDGTEGQEVNKSAIDPRCLVGDKLYFAGVVGDHNLHTLNIVSKDIGFASNENLWMPTIVGSDVYFMDLDHKERVYKMPLGGGEKVGITTYGTSGYNIDGNYLYYQSIKGNPDGLYRVDLTTGSEVLLAEGEFNSINVTSRYVYFADYFSGSTFHVLKGSDQVGIFNPPIQSLDE